MIYNLTIQTRANPQPISVAYETREKAFEGIVKTLERGYFQIAGDFFCILGPGCVLHLAAENADELEEKPSKNITHYVIVSMLGKQFSLEFGSELSADNQIITALKHGYFEQNFKGGEDIVYVYAEPGTTYLKLTAEAYDKLRTASMQPVKKLVSLS